MAHSRQAKKRIRQAEKSNKSNASKLSEMRTYIKKLLRAIADKNIELANNYYIRASKTLDRLARKKLIQKNKAARYKSRLNAKLIKITEKK